MGLPLLRQQWIRHFTQWAQSRRDIRTVFLVGSCARIDLDAADEWSDVDVLVITTNPELYTRTNAWMHELGSFWTGILPPDETIGNLLPVFCGFSAYDQGLVAEYFILSYGRAYWATSAILLLNGFPALRHWLPESISSLGADVGDLLRKGARVLVDKDGFANKFCRATTSVENRLPEKPSQEEFNHSVGDFWFGPPKVVADLRRGRLLAAMKGLELTRRHIMKWAEWQARAKDNWQVDDSNYRLSNINHWADPRIITDLPNMYAHFDAGDIWQKLFALMQLAQWLVPETAQALGYQCCDISGQQIANWVKKCFDEEAGQVESKIPF